MRLLDYLKYGLYGLVAFVSVIGLLLGGNWIVGITVGIILFFTLGDVWSGQDTSAKPPKHPFILTVILWLTLPTLSIVILAASWSVSSYDFLSIGAILTDVFSYDFIEARERTSWIQHTFGAILTGLLIGSMGTVVAHELTHRTWDKVSLSVGRWLLAFSFDTSFSIEHVYGHHLYVATKKDPATAPRGRTVYAHIILSTIQGQISAWNIEKNKLRKKKQAVLGMHNKVLVGHAMSLFISLVVFILGGFTALLFFLLCAGLGKALLEIVNYMEHYGLVRVEGEQVEPRHSWNTNQRLSSWYMINLTRHSHHHAEGNLPFHALKPMPEAPMMLGGILATIILTLIPPLWFRLMAPKLQHWDEYYATFAERKLID